MFNTAHHTVAI